MKKETIHTIFQIAAFALCLWGVVLTCRDVSMLRYYTVQSNLLCLVFWGYALIRRGKVSPRLQGAVTLAILLTCVVYNFVLVPAFFAMGTNYSPYSLSDLLVHTFTPLLMLLDSLLFMDKGKIKRCDPLLWTVIPYAYFAFTLIIGFYPYFFSDPTKNTVPQLIFNLALVTVAFVGAGYALYFVDKRLAGRKQHADA